MDIRQLEERIPVTNDDEWDLLMDKEEKKDKGEILTIKEIVVVTEKRKKVGYCGKDGISPRLFYRDVFDKELPIRDSVFTNYLNMVLIKCILDPTRCEFGPELDESEEQYESELKRAGQCVLPPDMSNEWEVFPYAEHSYAEYILLLPQELEKKKKLRLDSANDYGSLWENGGVVGCNDMKPCKAILATIAFRRTEKHQVHPFDQLEDEDDMLYPWETEEEDSNWDPTTFPSDDDTIDSDSDSDE